MREILLKLIVPLMLMISSILGFSADSNASAGGKCQNIAAEDVPEAVTKFVPSGWQIESLLASKLSRDSTEIYVSVLTDRVNPLASVASAKPNVGNRKLLIVIGNNNDWRLSAIGDKVLRCAKCYGALGGDAGGSPDVAFKQDILTIHESGGSREMWDVIVRFRYDFGLKRFVMIERKITTTDRISHMASVNTVNYTKGTQIIEITSIDDQGNRHVMHKEKKIKRFARFIENYDFESEDKP